MAANLTGLASVLGVITAVANGDLSKKTPSTSKGEEILELKDTINTHGGSTA